MRRHIVIIDYPVAAFSAAAENTRKSRGSRARCTGYVEGQNGVMALLSLPAAQVMAARDFVLLCGTYPETSFP